MILRGGKWCAYQALGSKSSAFKMYEIATDSQEKKASAFDEYSSLLPQRVTRPLKGEGVDETELNMLFFRYATQLKSPASSYVTSSTRSTPGGGTSLHRHASKTLPTYPTAPQQIQLQLVRSVLFGMGGPSGHKAPPPSQPKPLIAPTSLPFHPAPVCQMVLCILRLT